MLRYHIIYHTCIWCHDFLQLSLLNLIKDIDGVLRYPAGNCLNTTQHCQPQLKECRTLSALCTVHPKMTIIKKLLLVSGQHSLNRAGSMVRSRCRPTRDDAGASPRHSTHSRGHHFRVKRYARVCWGHRAAEGGGGGRYEVEEAGAGPEADNLQLPSLPGLTVITLFLMPLSQAVIPEHVGQCLKTFLNSGRG